MTIPSLTARRLSSQQLAHSKLKTPAEVVAWLGVVQSQDYAGSKWSIGLRLPGAADAAVEQAIASKSIVRTWTLRGTLHFVTAQDIRWMLSPVARRVIERAAFRYRQLELDEKTLVRSNDLLFKAVQGGKQLGRTQLLALLEHNGISTTGQRAPHLLQRASLDGLICQGLTVRNNPIYMALDEALPSTRPKQRAEALAELAMRYFLSHGPATLQDFVWWSGLVVSEVKAALEVVKPKLVQETISGQTYWLSPATPATRPAAPQGYLLPAYDEYPLAYKDRSTAIDLADTRKVFTTNGLTGTMSIDGRILGTWRRRLVKGTAVVTLAPFSKLTARQSRAIATALQRYGDFLGMLAKQA